MSTTKTINNDRNAALLKRLMECAVDEIQCDFTDQQLYTNCSIYDDGYSGLCYVAHISDVRNSICFILDVDRMPEPAVLFAAKKMQALNRMPAIGEIFAYHFNQKFIFRAMRCSTTDSEAVTVGCSQYYAKFIDIGSTMWIDATNGFQNHFELDESIQRIPPYAIKCQIVQMPSNYSLMNLLHEKVSFRIIKRGNNIMYVELLSQNTNPFLCIDAVGGNNEHLYAYFNWFELDDPSFVHNKNAVYKNGISSSIPASFQRFEPLLSNGASASSQSGYVMSDEGEKRVGNHFLEMINTTIRSKAEQTDKLSSICDLNATTNWNTHENRMQQFADALSSDDDNLIESYENSVVDDIDEETSIPKIRLPCIGDTVSISVSFVIDAERFYAFIPSCLSSTTMNVQQLQSEMNTDDNRRKYKPFELTPPIHELVFALYHGYFYRAKVIAHYDERNFQVFYIDYGNCAKVHLMELFEWDARWDHVPAQIFLCRLHGMRKIRFFDFEAMMALSKLILNQPLKAKVTNIIDTNEMTTIVLSVRDIDDRDVMQTMCEKNYARPN